jgi:hypothetical protein
MRAHLAQAANLAVDQIVGEVHEERLVADRGLRTQNRVPETLRHSLPHEDTGGFGRHDVANQPEQVVLTGFCELPLELGVSVEVVLDRSLR